MQIPTRKYDKIPKQKSDPHITEEKFKELSAKRDRLIKIDRPREAAEVQRLALMGDFSENAGYQLAKARLRGINNRILEIEDLLKRAEIIKPANNGQANLGNTVVLENEGRQKSYQILGSAETDPAKGIISQNSPLGSSLLGKKIGDEIEMCLKDKIVYWKIVDIR